MNIQLVYALALWLVLISAVTAAVTAADKLKAKKGSFRIPERVLFLLALAGGSLAEYITMRCIRHKTLHKRFMLGLPLIMIAQITAVCLLFIKLSGF